MFFVGATGQILTLILTLCLPFVLLVSGNPKIEVQSPASYLVVNQNAQEISSHEIITFCNSTDFLTEENNNHRFKFDDFPEIYQFPSDNFHNKWKSVYSTSSGNKAPPVFHYLYC